MILAIDTATRSASVALLDPSGLLAERTWVAGQGHSAQTLAEIDRMLELVGRAPADLSGIGVTIGPGSFTGVRVGLSLAKGFSFALGVPLWGFTSLEVLAHAGMDGPQAGASAVRPLVELGRGRIATALYRHGTAVEPASGITVTDLLALPAHEALLIGDIPDEVRDQADRLPGWRLASRAASVRRAGYLAELAWLARVNGDPDQTSTLDAFYLPSAVESRSNR